MSVVKKLDNYSQKQIELNATDLENIQIDDYPEVYDTEDLSLGSYVKVEIARLLKMLDPMMTNQDMLFVFINVNNTVSLTKMVNYLVEKFRIHENYRLVDYKFNSVMTSVEGYDGFDFSVSLQFKSTT